MYINKINENALWYLVGFFVFVENTVFSHAIHLNYTFPSFYPSQSPASLLYAEYTPFPLPFRKEEASKRQQASMTKQDTMRQGKSPHLEAGHGNPIGGQES